MRLRVGDQRGDALFVAGSWREGDELVLRIVRDLENDMLKDDLAEFGVV